MSTTHDSLAFTPDASESISPSNTGDAYTWLALRSHAIAEWAASVEVEVDQLAQVSPNWNSYGSLPVKPGSVGAAREIVAALARVVGVNRPDIALSPNGLVTLSWSTAEGREVEVEVSAEGVMAVGHYCDVSGIEEDFSNPRPNPNC